MRGVGLGVTIAHRAAAALGGELTLRPAGERGTVALLGSPPGGVNDVKLLVARATSTPR